MRRTDHSGWILIETLVALTVLSIAGVALNRALFQAQVTRAQARDYTQARFMLERLISELEMQPVLVAGTESGDFGDAHPVFTWTRTAERIKTPPPATAVPFSQLPPGASLPVLALGKLTATVHWTRNGRPFDESVTTLIPAQRIVVPEEDAHDAEPRG